MTAFVVTYVVTQESKRPPIVAAIKDVGNWAMLSATSFAVATESDAQAVFEKLKPLIDDEDNLYVIPLTGPYMGFAPRDVNEWLDNNLPQQAFQ